MIALYDNHPSLPGGQAEEFFENWLAGGTGGTCWPSSNALFELVRSIGFAARRVARSMRDAGVINHASVIVRIEHRDWLVDSSMLTNEPLPLQNRLFIHNDPVFCAEVEPVDSTYVIWTDFPPNPMYLPCRLLVDRVSHAFYLDGYTASRERSPFNQRLYARRNYPGELIVLLGATRFSKTAGGLKSHDLSREKVCQALREDIALSDAVIDEWVRSGSLDASFEPPSGPKPPPITRQPPSQRNDKEPI